MNHKNSRNLWPYDEVTILQGQSPFHFVIESPWISASLQANETTAPRIRSLSEKMKSQALSVDDLGELTALLSSLSGYPLSYILPLPLFPSGLDHHQCLDPSTTKKTPRETFLELGKLTKQSSDFETVAKLNAFDGPWKWDHSSALQISQTAQGFDPLTIFSVARRFHLLDSVESNKTQILTEYVNDLKDNKAAFQKASALIVRQNHFVTEKCDSSLRPALALAQQAESEVLEFIQAESGHDSILGKALEAMNLNPGNVPVIEPIKVLMELFRLLASKNFLAFSMAVDMFERSSYQEHDPLASLLSSGGEEIAAKQIDIHKDINDAGEHENIAQGFLEFMAPVDEAYAREALKMAELITNVFHTVSSTLLEKIKESH